MILHVTRTQSTMCANWSSSAHFAKRKSCFHETTRLPDIFESYIQKWIFPAKTADAELAESSVRGSDLRNFSHSYYQCCNHWTKRIPKLEINQMSTCAGSRHRLFSLYSRYGEKSDVTWAFSLDPNDIIDPPICLFSYYSFTIFRLSQLHWFPLVFGY